MPHLVRPSLKYKKSFLKALREFQAEGRFADLDSGAIADEFAEFIRRRRARAKGKYLPRGFVPDTICWLVDGNEFIGEVSIRHRLTKHLLRAGGHIGYEIRPSKRRRGYGTAILKLALRKAKILGIHKALLTCDVTNIGSEKIIRVNGGRFKNRISMGKARPDKLRFWIDLGDLPR